MMSDTLGLYVHIPFCVRKCNYCDFCSFPGVGEELIGLYTDAVCRELDSQDSAAIMRAVDTVYIGGGTPSLLEPEYISRIMSVINGRYNVADDAEITIEANPGTLSADKLSAYRSFGINRISIGLQSANELELRALGRIHTSEDFVSSVKLAREAGFDNISADVMYGIPHQTYESFARTLECVTSLEIEHISAYSLKIEEGTPFAEVRNTLKLPDEDEEYAMYTGACDILASRGYRHYEISNYAKEGRESRHNLRYWHDLEYIGVGCAAYSYFGGKRYGNTRDIAAYIENKTSPVSDCEIVDRACEEYEYVMLALRLADGVSDSDFRSRFKKSFNEKYIPRLKRYIDMGLAVHDGDRTYLTERGMYLSNSILVDILD